MFRWPTSERAKSIATILSAVGSMVAVIVTALKPSGNAQASQAYELIRAEVESQREEIYALHKSLVGVETWFSVWREFESARKREMQELRENQVRAGLHDQNSLELHEVPPPPPPIPEMPTKRAELPPAKNLF